MIHENYDVRVFHDSCGQAPNRFKPLKMTTLNQVVVQACGPEHTPHAYYPDGAYWQPSRYGALYSANSAELMNKKGKDTWRGQWPPMAQEEVYPLHVSRVTSILTKGNATRQAGKNKLQTEDMDSEEDENVKRRLRSTSASAGQVWRKHAVFRDVLDKVVPVVHRL